MESAQIPKQPANRKLSPMATAAFAGLVAVGLATAYGVDASRNQGFYRRNAMHTTGLMRFKLHVETPSAFPYSFSPWEKYAQIEEELLDKFKISEKDIPRQTKRIISVANDISDRVAKRMLMIKDTYDVNEVSKVATRDSVMMVIADEIAKAGVFYSEESLLSNSFNPKMHEGDGIHLDCKLLSYLMCHIGRRLNLEIYIVNGPSHMYLYAADSTGKSGYVIESTKFRKIEISEDQVNYGGMGIDEGFISTFAKQRNHGGMVAAPEFERAANFHVPVKDIQLIEDDIRASIIVGLNEYAKRKKDLALKLEIYLYLFGIVKSGTDSYLATSNAFTSSLTLAEECIEQKNYRHAEVLLKNAIWVRTKKDELIVNKEPVEEVLLGKLYWEMGEKRESLIQLREANRLYRNRGLLYINGSEDTPMALNRYHCILLRYLAIAERDNGTMPPSRIYNELLIPAYNFYTVNELEDDPEFQILKELKNSLYARIQRAGYFGLF